MTYLPRANEPVEPHVHEERAADGTWGCSTCIADEAAAGGGGGGGVGPAGPPGPAGSPGAAGAAATVAVGTTTTGAAGSAATVTNTGSSSAAVFNFKIPAGAVGAAGPAGTVGATGPAGAKGDVGATGAPGAPGADGKDGRDGVDGQQGIQGIPGMGVTFKGSLPTIDDLPDGAAQGDLYLVEDPAPAHGWVWDVAENSYVDAGPMQGPQGIAGKDGSNGVDGKDSTVPGPTGPAGADSTVAGPKGDTGAASTVPGPAGPAGPTAVSADAGNTSVLGTDGKIFTPAGTGGGATYTLPVATSSVLGGVKVGTGLTVDGTGVLSATVATGFLPTTGGTMTGTITVPTTVQAFTFGTSGYNIFGASGGMAVRSNTTNIMNFTAVEVVAYVPITTAGSGVGVKFGSGGPTLSKSGTMIAASAPITVAAAPATDTELANKAYVDSKSGGGSSVTNPVAGSVAGMTIWTGTQAAYDALTKSATGVYFITG